MSDNEIINSESNESAVTLPDLDKSLFSRNLNYLLKTKDLNIGQFEKLLGITAGYISRTINPVSDKRLSIDVMWKISYYFGISIDDLISTDLTGKINTNADMIARFILTLKAQTLEDNIKWTNCGGKSFNMSSEIKALNMFSEIFNLVTYVVDSESLEMRSVVDDIFMLPDIYEGTDLIIIPYQENDNPIQYDFVLAKKNKANVIDKENLFDTGFSKDDTMRKYAEYLYSAIKTKDTDFRLKNSAKDFISYYLNKCDTRTDKKVIREIMNGGDGV